MGPWISRFIDPDVLAALTATSKGPGTIAVSRGATGPL
jgi:hypothetical protein